MSSKSRKARKQKREVLPVSLRLTGELIAKIDDAVNDGSERYRSRSHFIERAVGVQLKKSKA